MKKILLGMLIIFGIFFMLTPAEAVPIVWTDWTSSSTTGGFTAEGTMTTSTAIVDVMYNNPQGVGFFQDGVGSETDWWANRSGVRDETVSPYTSTFVDNIPTGTDMIGLQWAGSQTLTFSEAIANPVFAYISLNGNGYAFDQDFEVLSFGDSSDGNECGWWGCGTSYKSVVDLGGGVFEYQLLGTGEPHGAIRFTGAFDTVSWRSLSNEYWNGFTVGIEGTEKEVFPVVPEPATMLLFGSGLIGAFMKRKRSA